MGFFVVGDVFEVAVVGAGEAGGEKITFGHGADAEFVEDVFEVLELGVVVSMRRQGEERLEMGNILSGRIGGCRRL